MHHKLKNKNIMKEIVNYNKCQCGAIELIFEDRTTNHILEKNLKKFGVSLKGIKRLIPNDYVHCDHCVNHYGVDICECGSGLEPDKCCKKGTTETLYETVPPLIEKYNNTPFWKAVREIGKSFEEAIEREEVNSKYDSAAFIESNAAFIEKHRKMNGWDAALTEYQKATEEFIIKQTKKDN